MADIPPFYGQTSLRAQVWKFTGDFQVTYNGWKHLSDYTPTEYESIRYTLPGKGSPAWYTLNFSGELQATKHIKVQAGIQNILDVHYRTYSSGISAPGRNIYTALRISF
jgi:hemoglobin/transferrin/lactoferrin receptor protein